MSLYVAVVISNVHVDLLFTLLVFPLLYGYMQRCIEYTNAVTCNGTGIAQVDGTCDCKQPELGTGRTDCSTYSNNETCSGKGETDADGVCTCWGSETGVGQV